MITVNLFTSCQYTQPIINVLKEAKGIKLLNVYKKWVRPTPADVFVLANFREIIPPKALALPKYGWLGLHPSLLPQYRGPAPVQGALLAGAKETGLTIFKMDEKVDRGPIVAQFKEEIKPTDTAEALYHRLFSAGAQVLVSILPAYVKGQIKARPQNHQQASYTKRLTRNDGQINWQKTDEKIDRLIRALTPWPGTWTEVKIKGKTKRLKILKASLKKGRLNLDQVQLEGKKPVSWQQFQEGYPKAKIKK